MADEQLDNPAWWALRGPHARFAVPSVDRSAVRYQPDVSPFAAVDRVDESGWAALGRVAAPGDMMALFRDQVGPVPDGWTEVFRADVVQMVSPGFDGVDAGPAEVAELGDADVDAMVALARHARPGPFEPRTHQLGRFVGVWRAGRLIAMAGERFRDAGATEISAVCTDEAARREGWGERLTIDVARRIEARGDVAFLHVESTNENALRLYQRLGFTVRRVSEVVAAVSR